MLRMGTRDLALRVKILPMGTREKKRNPRQMMASCLSKLHSDPTFYIAFFRHWAPTPAPEPSPGFRLCRGIAAALPARNSCASARLLEAAVARFVGRSVRGSVALGPSLARSVGRSLSVRCSVARSLGRSVALSRGRSVGRAVIRSVGRPVCRSVALGPSFGRSVARSLGRSVAQAFGRSVARSLGRSVVV